MPPEKSDKADVPDWFMVLSTNLYLPTQQEQKTENNYSQEISEQGH